MLRGDNSLNRDCSVAAVSVTRSEFEELIFLVASYHRHTYYNDKYIALTLDELVLYL